MAYRFLLQVWLGCVFLLAPESDAHAQPVRVGVFENPPIVSAGLDGTPHGISIDVIELVAQREGWQVSYVSAPVQDLIGRLERGEIDLLAAIGYSEEYTRRLRFSRESLIANWAMVFRRADVAIDSLPELKGRRVALVRGSVQANVLIRLAKEFDAPFTPVYVDDFPAVVRALQQRRADAGSVNRLFAVEHANQPGLVETAIVFNPVAVHYAAPRNADPALLDALDRHLAELKADTDSAYYASLKRWLSAAPDGRLPPWLPWLIAGGGGALLLALAFVVLLRHKVGRQTGELQRRADQLELEVEQREQAQQHLNRLAYFDGLTRLPNRESFRLTLSQTLRTLNGTGGRLALLFIDVDRLKNVNDGLGHRAGDMLLQQIASRLQSVLRAHDHLSRFGGDEFVVIVSEIVRDTDAERVAARLLAALAAPVDIGGTRVYTGASIGIALYPEDAGSLDGLLKHADTAMYQAKEQGGNRYLFYHAQQTERAVERLTLDTRLRQALERDELVLYYQPIVELASGRIVGGEALLRWQDPERGLVMPSAFIPAAEDTGLIVALSDWVLEACCTQLRTWQQQGRAAADLTLSVNVSTRQFEGQHLTRAVDQALARSGLRPDCLELEITENVMLVMTDEVRSCLDALRARGVRLALDDFGTGYSSLSYLSQLPFHGLKIDQSFVRKVPQHPSETQIVTTILALAKGLAMEVVAEGIETAEQYDFLRDRGCEFGQGHLMGEPQPADAFAALLGRQEASGPHSAHR